MDWHQWTSLNRQLLDEWQRLLARPTPSAPAAALSEQEALALMSRWGDEVLAVFETGRGCTYLSPNWERISGHTLASCMGDNFYKRISEEQVKPFIASLQLAVCGDVSTLSRQEMHLQLCHADGRVHTFQLRIGEVSLLPNGQHRIACMLKDIQAMLDAREVATAAKEEMHAALSTRAEFLANMSHDLRTPLNAILGFTQIMESGMYGDVGNPHYREYLRHIRESGYELLAQIDDLLDCSEPRSSADNARTECDIGDLVAEALLVHKNQAASVQVMLVNDTPKRLARVMVDRLKLMHALSHILSNAIRFSRAGGRVCVSAHLDSNNEMVITVRDHGVGMSARKLQSLIKALRQENDKKAEALGYGLSIAKEFARLHGGYLTIDSKAGAGSTVSLCLPAECVAKPRLRVIEFAA